MPNTNKNKGGNKPSNRKNLIPGNNNPKGNYQIWIIAAIMLLIVGFSYFSESSNTVEITQREFEEMYRRGDVQEVVVVTNEKTVEVTLKKDVLDNSRYQDIQDRGPFSMGQGPHYRFNVISAEEFKNDFGKLEKESDVDPVGFRAETREPIGNYIFNGIFILLLVMAFWYIMRRMAGGGAGGQIFNIGKSKASLFDADNDVKVSFKDVAGLDEAKEEVKEIVDFLKSPDKYTDLGGKIPKGALLVGPPGTGKTLLAKAVAGEAGVPFFSMSGSDFVEMFVGVGAARVRDLFRQAKEKAPCIIFIDEIDAIGRSRGKGQMPGSNDERENTLNSLLVEMDGFGSDTGVIILGATNRPDVLDNALLRPGRFDRQISIDKPDIVGREDIFKVHLKPIKLSDDIDPKKLAAQTPGFAGAEIANVCNEAALIAARRNKKKVDMQDFQDAVDRVIGGLEKKNKLISPEEKKTVAFHEAGHAVAGWFLEHADPLVKVSIVPRGIAALGYAQYLPKEQFLHTRSQLIDEMCMALGGRAAEELTFGEISTGALSDLERITKMAYSMVTVYGMNEIIGNISYYDSKQSDYNFTKPYSDDTAKTIDEQVRAIVDSAYQRTRDLLDDKSEELKKVAEELLDKEILFQADLERLIGERPFGKPTTYQKFAQGGSTNGSSNKEKEEEQDKEDKEKPSSEEPSDAPEESSSVGSSNNKRGIE